MGLDGTGLDATGWCRMGLDEIGLDETGSCRVREAASIYKLGFNYRNNPYRTAVTERRTNRMENEW